MKSTGFAVSDRAKPTTRVGSSIVFEVVGRAFMLRFDGNRWELVGAESVSADALEVAGDRVEKRFELWRYQLRRLSS